MSHASSNARLGILYLLVTAIGWGMNWPLVKIILRELPPLFARGSTGLAAAALLAILATCKGESLKIPRGSMKRLCIASALNVFSWMGFATLAMLWLTVAETALIVYTMPIWATLLSWPILGTRPTWRAILALVLGTAGIAVLLAGPDVVLGASKLVGIALALASAVLFALGAVTARKPINIPPFALTAWQVGLGCAPMVLIGLLFEDIRISEVTTLTWLSMLYMVMVSMSLCYVTWFATLRNLSPGAASTGMLLVPVIGIVSAGLMIGEPLGIRELAALALTLGGVMLAVTQS